MKPRQNKIHSSICFSTEKTLEKIFYFDFVFILSFIRQNTATITTKFA
jgi:hypothetical protein